MSITSPCPSRTSKDKAHGQASEAIAEIGYDSAVCTCLSGRPDQRSILTPLSRLTFSKRVRQGATASRRAIAYVVYAEVVNE